MAVNLTIIDRSHVDRPGVNLEAYSVTIRDGSTIVHAPSMIVPNTDHDASQAFADTFSLSVEAQVAENILPMLTFSSDWMVYVR